MDFFNHPPAHYAGIQPSTRKKPAKMALQNGSQFKDQADCPAPSLTQKYTELIPKGISGSSHAASSKSEGLSCVASTSQSPAYKKVQSNFTFQVPVPLTPAGPTKRTLIGPEGGRLEIYGNVLTFPKGAVNSPTTIDFGLVWNNRLRPVSKTGCQMTAIVSCEPSDVTFSKPVVLTLPHCLVINPEMENMLQPLLLHSHRKEEEQPMWEEHEIFPANFTLKESTIDIQISNFCLLTVQLRDGTKVDAKKIHVIPYSSAANRGQDLKIRVYIINAVEETEERVKQKESEIGGERLAECNFLLLGNCGTLNVQMKWHSPGWSKQARDIQIPFREMWVFDHHVKELYLENTTNCKSFHCEMQISQEKNDSVMHMPFSREIQLNSQKTHLKGVESPLENQCPPCLDSKPVSGDLVSQLMLPCVPPLPYVPEDLLSCSFSDSRAPTKYGQVAGCASSNEARIPPPSSVTIRGPSNQCSDACDSRNQSALPLVQEAGFTPDKNTQILGKFVSDNQNIRPSLCSDLTLQPIQQGISSVGYENKQHRILYNEELSISEDLGNRESKNTSASSNKRAVAVTQYFINSMTVHGERNSQTFSANPSIIPLSLQNELGSCLDSRTSVAASWIDLAKHWDLEDYSWKIERENFKGFALLTLASEKRKFRCLEELREALEEIGRDDCVELVKIEENRALKRKRSSEASVEAMECDESPSPKSDKPRELIAANKMSGFLPFTDDVFPKALSSIEEYLPASDDAQTAPRVSIQETRDSRSTSSIVPFGLALVPNHDTQATGSTQSLRDTSKDGMGFGASNQSRASDVLASHGMDQNENVTPVGQ